MGRHFAKICQTEEERDELREVFARALAESPLFRHIAPGEKARYDFVRRYLGARFDDHIRNGNSLLVAMHVTTEPTDADDSVVKRGSDTTTKIVGGVLFTFPAEDRIGYRCTPSDANQQSYNRFKLKDIDEESFQRLLRYEQWENQYVRSEVARSKIPLWNGSLYAFDPAYSGSLKYADCLSILSQELLKPPGREVVQAPRTKAGIAWNKNTRVIDVKTQGLSTPCKTINISAIAQKERRSQRFSIDFLWKLLPGLTLMTRHAYVPPQPASEPRDKVESSSNKSGAVRNRAALCFKTPHRPLVWVVSHSRRDVQYHQRNGFCSVKEVAFPSLGGNESPFDVTVLLGDVFCTGKLKEIASSLASTELNNNAQIGDLRF